MSVNDCEGSLRVWMVGLVGEGGVTDRPVDTVLKRRVAECEAEGAQVRPLDLAWYSLLSTERIHNSTVRADTQVHGAWTGARCAPLPVVSLGTGATTDALSTIHQPVRPSPKSWN